MRKSWCKLSNETTLVVAHSKILYILKAENEYDKIEKKLGVEK